MRGKRCAGLSPMLLSAALLGAAPAAAENAPSPAAGYPATIVVLDASSSMNTKIGSATKIAAAKAELGAALGTYAGRLSFGLVALGHRKASNCADSETLAKPGELTFAAKDKLFDKIKPKGQAPIAAALSDAAKAQVKDQSLDIVLIADGGDTCDADICSTAVAMKEKSKTLRIHVVGYSSKADELKPLACLAGVTGGTFVAATNAGELKQGLTTVLDAIANPAGASPQAVAAEESPAPPALGALPPGVASAVPMILEPEEAAPPDAPAAPEPQSVVSAASRGAQGCRTRRRDCRAQIGGAASRRNAALGASGQEGAVRCHRSATAATVTGRRAAAADPGANAQAGSPNRGGASSASRPRHLQGARHRARAEAAIGAHLACVCREGLGRG